MKNLVCPVITLILLINSVYAQTAAPVEQSSPRIKNEKLQLNFGLNFGSAVFWENGELREDQNYVPGLGLRLGVNYNLFDINEKLNIETGLSLFLTRYSIEDQEFSYTNFQIGTQFLLNYRIYANWNIAAGPFVNIGLAGQQGIPGGQKYPLYSGNDLQEDAPLKRFDAGLALRAHYALNFSFLNDIYIQYRWGLSNIENSEAPSGIDQSANTRYFIIGVRSNLDNFSK